jgi:hypothetical protein
MDRNYNQDGLRNASQGCNTYVQISRICIVYCLRNDALDHIHTNNVERYDICNSPALHLVA